jgi:TonB family protein
MKSALVAALGLLCFATTSSAQETPAPARLDTVTIVAGTKLYPEGAAERGVQGKVTLSADLSASGSFANPAIHESSGSEELDGAALALAPRLKFTPLGSAGEPAPRRALVEIDFRKDTLASLKTKTCADFNLDAEYFKRTFSEKPLAAMPVFDLTAGVLALGVDSGQRLSLARNLAGIKERVIAECSQAPDSKFLELASKAARESLQQP